MEMRRGLLLVVVIAFMGKSYAQTVPGSYSETEYEWADTPAPESNSRTGHIYQKAVTVEVTETFVTVPVPAAPVLFTNDCFGERCDVSVPMQSANNDTEKDAQAKLSAAGDALDAVIKTKRPSADGKVQLKKQFERLQVQLEKSGGLNDSIRAVVMDIKSTVRIILADFLQVHRSRTTPEVLEKPSSQIAVLKKLYNQLAEALQDSPALYYRDHGDWRGETQTAVSLLAFMHWLETGNLLLHNEAEEKLGLSDTKFGLDVEDYLIGLCFMSNEMASFVVNQVTAGDYDCPRKVLEFMTELYAAFRTLNLRNPFLLQKFDGMKYDLRRVEEVHYDVRIRGLSVHVESTKAKSDKVEHGNTFAT